jgi:hypothetical protein
MSEINTETIKQAVVDESLIPTLLKEKFAENSDDGKTIKFADITTIFATVSEELGVEAPTDDELKAARSEGTKAEDDIVDFKSFCSEAKIYLIALSKKI